MAAVPRSRLKRVRVIFIFSSGDSSTGIAPQRLKPNSIRAIMYGLKAVPFKTHCLELKLEGDGL